MILGICAASCCDPEDGEMVMPDLKEPVLFANGDLLVREDGELIEIVAAAEKLFEIAARTPAFDRACSALRQSAPSAQTEEDRISISARPCHSLHARRSRRNGDGGQRGFQPARRLPCAWAVIRTATITVLIMIMIMGTTIDDHRTTERR